MLIAERPSYFMEIININSKISDILFSVDDISSVKYCIFRKENGDLVGAEDFLSLSGKIGLMKSLISKDVYHVSLYFRSNGEVVRRLKLLKKKQDGFFFNKLKNKWNSFYYRTLFSNHVVSYASFSDVNKKVEVFFSNGKKISLNMSILI